MVHKQRCQTADFQNQLRAKEFWMAKQEQDVPAESVKHYHSMNAL